jgi:fumarate reductase subunit C
VDPVHAEATNKADVDGGAAADSGRNETQNEKRDRNWNDLLQELRVMQTGTQIIAGFLLTLPFQQRFANLDPFGVVLYLVLVALAAVATCLMLVPVAMHRQLFGLRVKDRLVTSGHRVVSIVLWLIALLVTGTTALIFYVVLGPLGAAITAAFFAVGLVVALVMYPRRTRRGKVLRQS